MSAALSTITTASLAGLIAGVAYLEFRRRQARRLLPAIVLIVAALAVFVLATPRRLETKGPAEETIAVVFCYLAMLMGMVAQYGYAQAERGRKRLKFEPLQFMMPIFASPIVFIPLLTITSDMAIGGAFTKAKLMVYLVAFQNGFFWKSFFEQRRLNVLEPMSKASVEILRPATPERSRAAAGGVSQ